MADEVMTDEVMAADARRYDPGETLEEVARHMRAEFARHGKPQVWTCRVRDVLNMFADRIELAAARERRMRER